MKNTLSKFALMGLRPGLSLDKFSRPCGTQSLLQIQPISGYYVNGDAGSAATRHAGS
jgi:hypothetical protein